MQSLLLLPRRDLLSLLQVHLPRPLLKRRNAIRSSFVLLILTNLNVALLQLAAFLSFPAGSFAASSFANFAPATMTFFTAAQTAGLKVTSAQVTHHLNLVVVHCPVPLGESVDLQAAPPRMEPAQLMAQSKS